jgi:pyruvate dehydrogenase E1 component beta subunit
MFGGQAHAPLVLRMPDGAVKSAAAQHSSSPEAWFAHVPGLRVVVPAFPADAKSLLKAAIRSQDPVLYLEHKALYTRRGPVGDSNTVAELGRAAVVRPGRDVTVASWSLTLHKVLQAAAQLAQDGVCDVEVIDMRSLAPLDVDTVLESVRRTGRLLIAHEAVTTCGVGAELAAQVQEAAFGELAAPVRRVGNIGVPVPFAPVLERAALPQPDTIRAAIEALL